MKQEIELLIKKVNRKNIWNEYPVFSFTTDIDWASEDVLIMYFKMIKELEIKPTLFVTHNSEVINYEFLANRIERGIHPNFLKDSSHGNNFKQIIETCISYAPESFGFRSHRLFDVTDITHMLKTDYNYKYVSNLGTIMQPDIKPILHESGLIHFPIFFEDGTHLYNELDLNIKRYIKLFTEPGLKIICFHPMNFVFNSPTMPYMRKIKDSMTRQEFNNISTITIEKLKNKAYGINNTVYDIVNFVKSKNFPIYSLNELYNKLTN